MALADANVSEFEVACRGETDHERRDVRMRILDKVRDFAAHVHEPDLDKAWAYLQESRKDYDVKANGLSDLMSAVDDWAAMGELMKEYGMEWIEWLGLCREARYTPYASRKDDGWLLHLDGIGTDHHAAIEITRKVPPADILELARALLETAIMYRAAQAAAVNQGGDA